MIYQGRSQRPQQNQEMLRCTELSNTKVVSTTGKFPLYRKPTLQLGLCVLRHLLVENVDCESAIKSKSLLVRFPSSLNVKDTIQSCFMQMQISSET